MNTRVILLIFVQEADYKHHGFNWY